MSGPEIASFGIELAQAKMDGRRLVGYASVFDYAIETGTPNFPQKTYVRPGFFTQTLKQRRDMIQVLYHHGQDPQAGMVPLGKPEVMAEDKTGLWTETPLANTRFNNETLIPLLEDGVIRSMSIQFTTEQQSFNEDRSERNLEQGRLYEYGPTPFPANEAATASLHSLEAFQMGLNDVEFHWDGAAALRSCSTAAEFRQIAFERANDSDPDTAAHWALPHHPRPGAGPDSAGVAAALAALHGGRGGAPSLKQSVAAVEAHLQRHQGESASEDASSAEVATSEADPRSLARLRVMTAHDRDMAARWAAFNKLKGR